MNAKRKIETLTVKEMSTKNRVLDARILAALAVGLLASQSVGAEPSGGESKRIPEDFKVTSADIPPGALEPDDSTKTPAKSGGADSAKCVTFEKDLDANIGDVINAGCKPTTSAPT